jgi:exopolysaccharide production protein ExoZ
MRELNGIQYLRALAALSVLGFHVSEQFGGPFKLGAAGVDIFFVISGFIMWTTTASRPTTPKRFIWRRIVRIVPLYWIITVFTAAAILMRPQFFYNHILTAENFLGSLFFVPAVQDGDLHPVVIQGWTLCYEMMFYVLFALALFWQKTPRFWILAGMLVTIAIVHPFLPAGYAFTFSDPILLEFLAGAFIGQLWMISAGFPVTVAAAMVVVGFAAFIGLEQLAPEAGRIVRWGIPAILIVAGTALAEREKSWKPLPVLRFLGDASYSIYLWHVLLGVVVTAGLLRLGVPARWQPVAIGLFSLLFSAILYVVIEKPLIAAFRPRRQPTSGGRKVAADTGGSEQFR